MEDILHYLKILRIISKIPKHGRISIIENEIYIYEYTILNWVYRKLTQDNKYDSVQYLQTFYLDLNNFIDDFNIKMSIDLSNESRQKKKILLISIIILLKKSICGIENLINTYRLYPEIVSILELIINDIINPQYNRLSKFLPKKIKHRRRKSI